jgi:hypothetical protein
VPASALAKLAERTQGIPLLLAELVRGLKRDGLVRKSEKTNAWFLATDELDKLPDLPLVQWLASREMESLPPDLLAHARLASMLGVEFSAEELEGVMEELERAGAPPETQLDASIGVRRSPRAASSCATAAGASGSGTRCCATRSMGPSRPRSGRSSTAPPTITSSARTACPTRSASRRWRSTPRAAASRRRPASSTSTSASAWRRVTRTSTPRRSSRRPWRTCPTPTISGTSRQARGRGQVRFFMGRYEDASKDQALALERARKAHALLQEIDLLLDQGISLDWIDEFKRSAAVVAEAEALAKTVDSFPASIEARLLMGLGRTSYRAQDLPTACEIFKRAVAVAEPLGDAGYEPYIQTMAMLGFGLSAQGKLEGGEGRLRQVRRRGRCAQRPDHARRLAAEPLGSSTSCSATPTARRGLPPRRPDLPRVRLRPGGEHGDEGPGRGALLPRRVDEAEPLAQRVSDLNRMLFGEDSPRVAYATSSRCARALIAATSRGRAACTIASASCSSGSRQAGGLPLQADGGPPARVHGPVPRRGAGREVRTSSPSAPERPTCRRRT